MYKSILLPIAASALFKTSATASPVGDDGPSTALDALLEKRGEGDFRLFQRELLGSNHISIHTSCNGGGCGAEIWRERDPEEDLCGKGINVCGHNYAIRFTGNEPSCMRVKGFKEDLQHGDTYGELVDSDQKKVGTCYVDTKRNYNGHCGGRDITYFDSLVQCFFD